MNVQINDAYAARFEDSALSDNELDIVSGGERHQVSKSPIRNASGGADGRRRDVQGLIGARKVA
ncbi:hypothetical protein [Bradyrhizobium sp. AUGA SZCCT0160]|uniref:hypothetical protein n=1 Tax=Bradyrhizobium sp. AUGA SZCCT0160 TaxID=2807662 RepID=UPI001BA4DFF0|nr:hypothetical protein [Bradyrhizobium sp. AUGA SZCCT0160]MBR1192363.1 hypothetical protein [Bradyrhizobium sp. AUGA SZCCT0160]